MEMDRTSQPGRAQPGGPWPGGFDERLHLELCAAEKTGSAERQGQERFRALHAQWLEVLGPGGLR